jgi:hypothetical protein
MKKALFFLMLLMAFVTVAQAQTQPQTQPQATKQLALGDENDNVISLGLNAGISHEFNGYRMTLDKNGFDYYQQNQHFNMNANVGVMVSKKFRPRFEIGFVQTSYGMHWSSQYSGFEKTTHQLYNLDLDLHFDYSIFNSSKFQAYISPAFKSEFVLSDDRNTSLADGTSTSSKFSILDNEYRSNRVGGSLSMIFIYKVNNNFGFTLTPEYTYFFRRYVAHNSKPYQRFYTNLGFEYRF